MSFIQDSPRIMMSDSIANSVQEIDSLQGIEQKFIIANFFIEGGDKSTVFVGNVISYLLDEHLEIEVKVTIDDAFNVTKFWPSITIKKFEFEKLPDTIKFDGNYKISAMRVQEIDHKLQMCVIAMKLCKELHTYHMEFYI